VWMCTEWTEVTWRERERCACVKAQGEEKSVRKVLIVIWEVSTASRTYARMEWDDDDDDDDDASSVTTSSN
jgi:hypothetical protein